MAKETTAFKTGMTVLRGGNVPAYTLEYLSPGKRKQIGDFVTIVVPYAEMGRDNTPATPASQQPAPKVRA